MTDRRLLVLGASRYQLDAIDAARRCGAAVVTTDSRPDNPGHALADSSHAVDTTDVEGVLEVARAEAVTGVIAAGTDVAVPAAAYVAERMGLPGPPLAAARVVTDKPRFRSFQREKGLRHPEWHVVSRGSFPSRLDDGMWIIKPDRSSGSKGIRVVASTAEARASLSDALEFSPTGTAVIERYLVGHHGTCEGILSAGRVVSAFILDRMAAPLPYVTTVGHRVPTVLDPATTAAVVQEIEQTWSPLRVADGPFDCDFVVTSDGVYVLEISPRTGGNCIPTLLEHAWQFDLMDYSVRFALGMAPMSRPRVDPQPSAIVLLGAWKSGRLQYDIREARRLAREEWVKVLRFDFPQGETVAPFVNGRLRVGEAVVVAVDRKELDERVDELNARLAISAA